MTSCRTTSARKVKQDSSHKRQLAGTAHPDDAYSSKTNSTAFVHHFTTDMVASQALQETDQLVVRQEAISKADKQQNFKH